MAGYTPVETPRGTFQEPEDRPKATWRCQECKERMLVEVPDDQADLPGLYDLTRIGLRECDLCGSTQLRGPYFPIDLPYRLYEEAYRALANQGATVRQRIMRVMRDEVRHVLDDHHLMHGRCYSCMGLAIPAPSNPDQPDLLLYECLECGTLASELAPAPVPTRRPGLTLRRPRG